MRLKGLLFVGSMAVLGVAFTSCSKGEELYDSGAIVAQQKSEYATNFEKKYGPIDPNQTWDLATMHPISSLPSTSYAGTRGDGDATVFLKKEGNTGSMSVEKDVIDWMHTNMKAGVNNTKKGVPFYLRTQEQTFTVVPFYQGKASYYWELWMNVGGIDYKVWIKNDNLTYNTSDGKSHTLTNDGVPSNAVGVTAPTYTFRATPNQNLYFYLKVWTAGSRSSDTPNTTTTSMDKKMLALEGAKKPANVPEDNEVTIIGCEDGTDNDYEDLVFLIYGKPTPPIIPVDEIEITETKRYMMEDLGTTDDFDFNDVVVDAQNVYTQKIHLKPTANGGWEEESRDKPVYKGQRAIVRAAGGTLDFTVEIGTNTITRWSKSQDFTVTDMLNTGWGGKSIYYDGAQSILAKFDIEKNDWNPATNNIKVTVKGKGQSGEVKTITFPKQGEAPMMIAVDKDVNWMTERSSVPSSWWYKVD